MNYPAIYPSGGTVYSDAQPLSWDASARWFWKLVSHEQSVKFSYSFGANPPLEMSVSVLSVFGPGGGFTVNGAPGVFTPDGVMSTVTPGNRSSFSRTANPYYDVTGESDDVPSIYGLARIEWFARLCICTEPITGSAHVAFTSTMSLYIDDSLYGQVYTSTGVSGGEFIEEETVEGLTIGSHFVSAAGPDLLYSDFSSNFIFAS